MNGSRPHTGPARFLAGHMRTSRLAALLALMLLSSLSEGVGIVLLVPLLAALDGTSALAPSIAGMRMAVLPLGVWLGGFVVLVGLRAALVRQRQIAGARLAHDMAARLRARLLAALLHARWRVAGSYGRGQLLSRISADLDWVAHGLGQLAGLGASVITLAAVLAAALVLAPVPALALAAGGAATLALYRRARRHALDLGANASRLVEQFHALQDRMLHNLRLIKLYGREADEARAAVALEERLADTLTGQVRLQASGGAVLQTAGAAILALTLWLAVERWHVPALSLIPLVALFARLLPLTSALQAQWEAWLATRPSLDAVMALLAELEASREDPADLPTLASPCQSIALSGVALRHEGGMGVEGVELVLPIGSLSVLSGPSGAGKSTLADIFSGLVEPDEGELRIDGKPLGPCERLAWRRHVGYVQQQPDLFRGTIRDNLRLAQPDASDAQIEQALHLASAQFVLDRASGLDTGTGDDGQHLSGGERQRIALARALLRGPDLLIFDEPTSALDPQNSAAVIAAIAGLRGKVTMLVISHGGELAALADQLLRIERGRLLLAE